MIITRNEVKVMSFWDHFKWVWTIFSWSLGHRNTHAHENTGWDSFIYCFFKLIPTL